MLPYAAPEEEMTRPMFLASKWVRTRMARVEVLVDENGAPLAVRFPVWLTGIRGAFFKMKLEVYALTGKLVHIDGWTENPPTGVVTAHLRVLGGGRS